MVRGLNLRLIKTKGKTISKKKDQNTNYEGMKNIFFVIFLGFWATTIVTGQTADSYLIKAGILAERKQYSDAQNALSLSVSKENKHYTRIMAEIQYGLNNYAEASKLYSGLENNNPGTYRLQLARCAAMENNMSLTMQHLDQYFKSKNKLPVSKIINDDAFKKFRGNKTWENMWQHIDYSEPELKVNQVSSAAESGDYKYMRPILDEALRKYPNNGELLYYQSKLFYEQKMYGAAEKAINEAVTKSNSDKYYYQKSQIEQKSNNVKEALKSINEAIQKNPFELKYYVSRIDINKSMGNTAEADQDLKLLNFCMPDSPDVQFAGVKMEADKGNYLNAIAGLNDLIEIDQTNEEYFVLRGKLNLKTQKLQNADEDFGMALDLNPSDAEANFGKGLAKYKLEDNSAACYYWQKAANEGSREALEYLNKYCGK